MTALCLGFAVLWFAAMTSGVWRTCRVRREKQLARKASTVASGPRPASDKTVTAGEAKVSVSPSDRLRSGAGVATQSESFIVDNPLALRRVTSAGLPVGLPTWDDDESAADDDNLTGTPSRRTVPQPSISRDAEDSEGRSVAKRPTTAHQSSHGAANVPVDTVVASHPDANSNSNDDDDDDSSATFFTANPLQSVGFASESRSAPGPARSGLGGSAQRSPAGRPTTGAAATLKAASQLASLHTFKASRTRLRLVPAGNGSLSGN